jgi:hypothetical protein
MNTHSKERNAVNININVKRKFKVNGKEYNSIEELPVDIRKAFEKAMASQAGSGLQATPATIQTKIIFNGTEYKNIDEMPDADRHLYEKVLRAAETGAAPPEIDLTEISSGMRTEPGTFGTAHPDNNPQPAKFESPLSARTLIVIVILFALIFLLYYLWQFR